MRAPTPIRIRAECRGKSSFVVIANEAAAAQRGGKPIGYSAMARSLVVVVKESRYPPFCSNSPIFAAPSPAWRISPGHIEPAPDDSISPKVFPSVPWNRSYTRRDRSALLAAMSPMQHDLRARASPGR